MLCLRYSIPYIPQTTKDSAKVFKRPYNVVICAARGPRPRYPRVWKTRKRIGTVSKAAKLIDCIKGLSNVKEEVYGALDSFIAWDLEFPLVTVKKALQTLEDQREWKKIIQVTKWMLSKGQGRTMGTYFTLLNALAEDERLDEAEELWNKIFMDHLEGTPRKFFNKIIAIYYKRGMYHKLFEVFADMEELGVKPNVAIVSMVGRVFQKLDMMDKYEKLMKKYPPPKWEYRYLKGKRIRVRAKRPNELSDGEGGVSDDDSASDDNLTSKAETVLEEETDADNENHSEEEEEEEEGEVPVSNQSEIGAS
ncbi:PREDICTED: pentatricopeptide repeat-containing protein At4g21190 [Tarenaya hassleriana]|uniref:pentatricopeptide repeat-containing protein At4g21190 n=1 Tax=Tarenaya hassleriana TaxID=28532 RepID=UPI00053C44DB|nr:PREDICTED: pentatricopeptide repeat-containing protein At4g21190 [Tarenaya hassleriana]XP_010537136.1 PREDICTED: pentatricopeptide repeat-containing protein At4g21190 [Tarenaya hassleriana]XP_010537137.1 PREDICTED: pentatricopeptide repeat-containing protein At4g21190 [Tarenaya hassleriana]